MSPFHSEMNHWQKQWLSDRLHKKNQPASAMPVDTQSTEPAKPRRRKKKMPADESAGAGEK